MKNSNYGLHLTDCGLDTTTGQGLDTQTRLESLYRHLGVDGEVKRETDAIAIAFFAATTAEAVGRVAKIPHNPIAFNRAPRTNHKGEAAQGGSLLYLQGEDGAKYLGYGEAVADYLAWFQGNLATACQIPSWTPRNIEDTRQGTQFRSLEYLVPIHSDLILQGQAVLEKNENSPYQPQLPSLEPSEALVLPSDEFGNGRLLLWKQDFDTLIQNQRTQIAEVLGDESVEVVPSLTQAQGLALWPSSNRLPNEDLMVANLGRKWEADHAANDPRISLLQPAQKLSFT